MYSTVKIKLIIIVNHLVLIINNIFTIQLIITIYIKHLDNNILSEFIEKYKYIIT